MDRARTRATVISIEMGKVMAMTVLVTTMRPQIAPRGDGKPAAKGNECEARDRVDNMAEALRESGPRQPHNQRDEQSREDVPNPGLKRGSRRFRFRSAPLPGD